MDFVNALKSSSKAAVNAPKKVWQKHDSGILTAVTIVSTGLAVYFALKDGPKAKKILDEKKKEGASNVEKAKAVLPVCGRTMMAVAVAWGSSILNHKRMTGKVSALVETVSFIKTMQNERREVEKEIIGDEKVQEIDKKVSEKRVVEKPVIMSEIETTGHGNYIFREPMTGKTFRASKDFLELVVGRYSDEMTRMHNQIREGKLDPDDDSLAISMDDIFTCGIGLSHCGFAELFEWHPKDNDAIRLNLTNTFEYEGPDGTLEPGYVFDFFDKPVLAMSSYSTSGSRRY